MKPRPLKPKHLLYLAITALLFSSCAKTVPVEILSETSPYGFWNGLWHGIISPITLIITLFREDVAMYAIHNNGAWYNVGFLFGTSLIFSGGYKGISRKQTEHGAA